MNVDERTAPEPRRAGVVILVGEWSLPGPEQQRRAADAALNAWRHILWPDGLIAYSCLLGEDERSVLHYSQWSGENAARVFASADKRRWAQAVDDSVPGIDRRGVTAYRLYRSTTPLDHAPPAGCLVTVTIGFDGPDEGRQQAWIDSVFTAAGTASPEPKAGMLAAHFHVSLDGTRVLNLAEWSTSRAHRNAVDSADASAQRLRAAVHAFPGVTRTVVRRYARYRRATPETIRPVIQTGESPGPAD